MELTRFALTMALLRGLVLLVAGVFALVSPANALATIVIVGACLLIVDGVLGLASQDYGPDRKWPFWLSLTRSVLAIVAGLAILLTRFLIQVMPLGLLATLVGSLAVIIGLIEIAFIIRDRKRTPLRWKSLAAAGLYVAVGLLLLFAPFAGAVLLVQIGGAILVVFAILQLFQTWSAIRNSPGIRPLT